MIYHILNGDCLAEQLNQTSIQGQRIVCAECLIDGDVSGDTLSEFWETRAKFISESYSGTRTEYFTKVVNAFDTILNLSEDAEVNLWFENDLFCQVNMWFVLSLIERHPPTKLYRIFPEFENPEHQWLGFGASDIHHLESAYTQRIAFSPEDISLGASLWHAYKQADFRALVELSKQPTMAYQQLEDVVQAHIDRFPGHKKTGRPEKAIRQLIEHVSTDFDVVFAEFSKQHGIYGFGDTQVRAMYDKIMSQD
jgi:hypothetical protein